MCVPRVVKATGSVYWSPLRAAVERVLDPRIPELSVALSVSVARPRYSPAPFRLPATAASTTGAVVSTWSAMKSIRISRPGWLVGSCARQQS